MFDKKELDWRAILNFGTPIKCYLYAYSYKTGDNYYFAGNTELM